MNQFTVALHLRSRSASNFIEITPRNLIVHWMVLIVIGIYPNKLGFLFLTGHVFVVNLAIADLIITSYIMPVGLATSQFHENPFGSTMCNLNAFLIMTSCGVSTQTLMAISLERWVPQYMYITWAWQGCSPSNSPGSVLRIVRSGTEAVVTLKCGQLCNRLRRSIELTLLGILLRIDRKAVSLNHVVSCNEIKGCLHWPTSDNREGLILMPRNLSRFLYKLFTILIFSRTPPPHIFFFHSAPPSGSQME